MMQAGTVHYRPWPITSDAMQCMAEMEERIRSFNHDLPDPGLLHHYLKLGQSLAEEAAELNLNQLQECWLRRTYDTLFETIVDSLTPSHWRGCCLDHLYQPLFALKRFYRHSPQGQQKINALCYELAITSRYCLNTH
ncbi:hypothetical protein [Pokkaliibacter plantistimulans]|uniref:hypothetical protein n=1 Tax=Pokkaliibacter plantistimulans TaxID=1635171 RepID=UPI000D743FF2|nr:hypothetical protein [Pokkaliibacter plantistimulans]